MPSMAKSKFDANSVGSKVLRHCVSATSPVCSDPNLVRQICLGASVAHAVGCWEGYIEAVLREFVAKVRVQSNRKIWTLISQFEAIVDRMAGGLNTPSWDNVRSLLVDIAGLDPYSAWVWPTLFSNPTDTKLFFEGILKVRHSFAHGFPIPHDVSGLTTPGSLDETYVDNAISCIEFFVSTTDQLLEHELKHRHSCMPGWN